MKNSYKLIIIFIMFIIILFYYNLYTSSIYEGARSKEARLYMESEKSGTPITYGNPGKSATPTTSTTPAISGIPVKSETPDDLKPIFTTSYEVTDGNVKLNCKNGEYISNGKCCLINTVNIQGNCISKEDADTKYQNDISKLINVEYHKSDIDLMKEAEPTDVTFGNTNIYDTNGNIISYPSSSVQGNITYYTPGSYPFGTANYVPNYEDSIYLSKLTGLSTTTPIFNTEQIQAGFCSYFENEPDQKEKVCSQLPSNECASTSCCVLLGGVKCVSGNRHGPHFKKNYGDIFIRNKDYYYYKGKCFGNCQ